MLYKAKEATGEIITAHHCSIEVILLHFPAVIKVAKEEKEEVEVLLERQGKNLGRN